MGLGLCVHVLMGFVLIIMLMVKEYRKNWRALVVTASCLILYLYIPIAMWTSGIQSQGNFVGDIFATITMLIGTLSIWDLPKRFLDIAGIIGVSIGVLTVIPLIFYFRKSKFWANPLFWLCVIPLAVFLGELDYNTYDYMMLAMPFLAIAIGLGVSKMVVQYQFRAKVFAGICVVCVLGFGAFNAKFLDIGRTLDKDMTTKEFYEVELAKLPDNAIFIFTGQVETLYKYNRDYGKHIYPITIGILGNETYMKQLAEHGIQFRIEPNEIASDYSTQIAKSIVELNDNVWVAKPNGKLFGYEVVEAKRDSSLIPNVDIERLKNISQNPQMQWQPYNPYVIITNENIEDWNYILMSNWNVRLFASFILGGVVINCLLYRKKKTIKYDFMDKK